MFLARRNLTAHPLRSFLTALAITLGVAMVLAAAIIGQAASEQANNLAEASDPRIDLEVFARDDKPFSADTLAAIRANKGVELASPSLSLDASVSNLQPPISLSLLGVEPAAYQPLRKPELVNGAFLSEDNAIVVPAALAIRNSWRTGDEIQLESGDRVVTVKIGGRLKVESGTTLGAAPPALVPLAIAQQLAGAPGQIDHVEIQLRAGADLEKTRAELASALGAELAVAQASVVGRPSFSTLTIQALLALVGVIILFAAGFVIANAFGMSITARLKEFGSLRTLGMTRRDTLNLVLLEAGVVGLAGVVGGVLIGMGIAWVALWAIGYGTTLSVPLWAVAFSLAMGLTVTLLSALIPAWQASRISPMEAVRAESGQTLKVSKTFRVSGRIGGAALVLIILGLGVFGFLGRPDLTTGLVVLLPSMVVLLAAMALLMPALVAPVATLVQPLLQRWPGGTAGRLAADNLRRNPVRAALTAAAMTAGLTMIIAISGLVTAFFKGGLQVFVGQVHEDRVIWPGLASADFRFDNVMEAFIDAPPQNPEMVARLKELEQTGAIELIDYDMAPVPSELGALPNYPGVFAEPEAFIRSGDFDFIEGNPADALKLMQRGRAVLIAPGTAARLNVHVGDDVKVQTPKGEVAFTVAGVGGVWWVMAVFPYADGQTYFGVGEPTFLGIVAQAGPDKEAALQRVDAIVKDYPASALNLNPADAAGLETFNTLYDQLALVLNALLLMAVVVAALGVVNTLVISVTERKREIGMLRVIGATQRQVRQMVMAEGATLGLLSVIFAIVLSLIILLAFILLVGNNGMASLGISFSGQQWVETFLVALRDMSKAALVCLFIAPLVAALAAYYPARQAAAMDVIDATRSEQLTLQPPSVRRAEGEDIEERALPRSLPLFLTQKSLEQQRTRAVLSVIAITLGATMTVAGDVLSKSIIGVVTRTEDLRAIGEGLWSQLDPAFKGIGAGIMLAAGFLVFNTFAMSITQRRQQIGALRSLGMTRGQVLRMVLTEALVIGGVGTLLGLVLGPFLGQGIIVFMRSLDNPILNAFAPSQPSLISFILAAVMGLGITVLASLMPARQAMRLSPLVALRAQDIPGIERNPNRLGLAGLLLCSLLTAYLVFSPPARWLQPPYDQLTAVAISALWIAGLALMLPALVDVLAHGARWLFGALRLSSAVFRLMADNLQRGRGRVLLTVATLAVSLTMIGALTGFIQFYLFEFFGPKLDALKQEGAWVASTMELEGGLAGYADMESLRMSPEAIAAMRATAGERANVIPFGFVIVPELSFMGDTYFSFIINPQALREAGSLFMTFKHGDWDTALPILERGCGVLMTPAIAARNNVSDVGDTFTVTSRYGQVECTVAGIGSTFVGATIISETAQDSFDKGDPFTLFIQSRPGVDSAQLEAVLQKTADQYGVHMMRMSRYTEIMLSVFDNVPTLFNAFLLMAVLAAALGVVNTTLLSVTERRREFGQLRALGATRAQVRAVVVGEAALMGFLGGFVGLVASVGLTVIFATVYGGGSVGVENYQPWAAAFRTLPKVLPTSLMGVLASPLICALAAYFPANSILRGAAIETLRPEQPQPITRRQIVGLLNRGSIQTRFAAGTAVLLLAVLAGLITVVTRHTGNYLESQHREVMSAMAGWNATTLELALPADARTLDLTALQSSQQFDADAMLRFRSLIDDMTEGGLEDFVIADREDIVLFSLDQRQIGSTLTSLESADKTVVRAVSVEGDSTPRLAASAPVRNRDDELVGSVRFTLRLTELKEFLERMRNTLWTAGGAILVLGLLASWALSAPFSGAVRRFGAQAARVGQGLYSPLPASRRRWPIPETSIRARLTILMTLLVAALVGGMGLVVIPIERDQLESTTKDSVLTAAQWISDAISESLGQDPALDQGFDLASVLTTAQNIDLATLQELTEQTRGETIAYLALVNTDGEIVVADKLALMGEQGETAARPQIADGEWRDEAIWIVSTPLRRGREGEQVGTLSFGVRRATIEAFLNESRNLFWLVGLSAVLAGVLLAQALGGAVAAPVEAMVAGTRQVARGDLGVRFRSDSRDELAQLGAAFNQMVAGLRERERLRDLFGRYVSREVSEAVMSGRVSLAGERQTITCLYCDMRGSTAFAEQYKPEEVMAALNQYFEVIILAVEAHGGIVNRFVGDEAVCLFGAPTECADHAERAVQAALSMREGLAYLNQKRSTLNLPTLRFGMGLNTGDVVAGATGSEERQEYTVIGDAMNLGARIQDLNKTFPDYDILLSEFTLAALPGAERYNFADLGPVEIRGKSQPVRVSGLVGTKSR
jgi:putative ABC transport system permease protein